MSETKTYNNEIYDLDGRPLDFFSCCQCKKEDTCHKIICGVKERIHDSGLDIHYEHRGFDMFSYTYQYFVKDNPEYRTIISKIRKEFCKQHSMCF